MASTILFQEQIEIPLALGTLERFRAWTASDEFPETGRIDFIDGRIEVDMSPEDIYTHAGVKGEIYRVIAERAKRDELGEPYVDGVRVACPGADLSVEPDVVLLRHESLNSGRVRLVPKASRAPDRYVEIEGPPDLIVEVISDSSEQKDLHRLPQAYFEAGVTESWLVDARGKEMVFLIHERREGQFRPVSPNDEGFQPSGVLNYRYQLVRFRNRHGRLEYDLQEKPNARGKRGHP